MIEKFIPSCVVVDAKHIIINCCPMCLFASKCPSNCSSILKKALPNHLFGFVGFTQKLKHDLLDEV